MPVAARVGQLIKFDGISFSHGGHTSVAASLPRSCLDCMRRSGAPCSSAEHLWCDALEVPVALAEVEGAELGGVLEVPVALAKVEGAEPGGALALVVMSSGMCSGLSFGISRCHQVAIVVFGVEVVSKCNR